MATLLPVCLIPLLVSMEGASVRAASLRGFVFGFVFWLVTIPWIAYTVHRYGEMPWPVAILALLLSAAIMAVPFGAMTAALALAAPRSPLGLVAGFAAAWVAQEGLRTYLFGGFPWALLAYPLAQTPELIQSAALGGVALTSFLVAVTNGFLYLAVTQPKLLLRTTSFMAAVCLVSACLLVGDIRYNHYFDAPKTEAESLQVGVVQTNVGQELRWSAGTSERIFRDLRDQTRQLVRFARPRPDVVLWPESASPFSWSYSAEYRRAVVELCRELDVAILLNTVWCETPEDDEAPYYNSALLVTKDGPVLPPYFKLRLVPFGEYVPLAPILGRIRPISRAVPGAFAAGREERIIPFRGRRFGGAICYEVVYPWVLRDKVRKGADLLFSLTNDAWFGTAGARWQHWQAAVFRSVETGRTLVRAAVTGVSGAVLENGHSIPALGPDERGSFVVGVPPPQGTPPAVRLGEIPLLVCAAGLLASILRRRAFKPQGRVAAKNAAERKAER